MKINQKLFYFLMFGLCFISLAIPINAQNQNLNSNADSCLNENSPDHNYGAATDVLIGVFNGARWEGVIMFSLSTEFIDFNKAELWFEVMSLEGPIKLEFYEITSFWTENSVTWNNAPSTSNFIANLSVSQGGVYKIDITTSVEYKTGPWSVRITSNDAVWVRLACKDTNSDELKPQIRFDHIEIGADIFYFLFVSILTGLIVSVTLIKKEIRRAKRI